MRILKTKLRTCSLEPAVAVFTRSNYVQMGPDGVGLLVDQRLSATRAKGRKLILFIRDRVFQTTTIFRATITTIRQAKGNPYRRHVFFRDAQQMKRPPASWRTFIGGTSCEIRYLH